MILKVNTNNKILHTNSQFKNKKIKNISNNNKINMIKEITKNYKKVNNKY